MSFNRKCGECNLCCKLVPVSELHKQANTKCTYQRYKKGCAVYPRRPQSCKLWSCQWLKNPDTIEMRRPDLSHYVIDEYLDYITVEFNSERRNIPVLQIWLDEKYPTAYKDPALLSFLNKQGEKGILSLIRSGSDSAFVMYPPSCSPDEQWHEKRDCQKVNQHTPQEIEKALRKNYT